MSAIARFKCVAFYSVAIVLMSIALGCESNKASSSSGMSKQSQPTNIYKQAYEYGWDSETNMRISMTAD